MRILLDSNAYSRLMRGDGQTAAVVRDATEILMSAVVVGRVALRISERLSTGAEHG